MITGKHLFEDNKFEHVMNNQTEHALQLKKGFASRVVKKLEKENNHHDNKFEKVKKVILKLVEYKEEQRMTLEELNDVFETNE